MDTTVANLTAGPDKDGADVSPQPRPERHHDRGLIHLARPYADGALAQTLKSRRSTKAFRPSRIDLDALSRLLATTLSTGPARSRPYGSAHGRFCWLEAGLLTQNIYLWAADNGLGTVFVGGLDPTKTQAVTASWLPSSHSVLGILPIGHPARPTSTP